MQKETIITLVSRYSELSSGVNSSNKVDNGYLSENYILESGSSKYFLKCYRFSDKRRILDAHKAKAFFFSKGVPVILPIVDKDGEAIQSIENRYFSLFPFISGFQYISGKAPVQAPNSLGRMLGRIHSIGETDYPDISEKFKAWDKMEFNKTADNILNIIDGKQHMIDFDVQVKKIIEFKKKCVDLEKLEYAQMNNLRIGLIHGDYHNGNVFFDSAGNVTHVFDFEKTCIAPFVFEITRAIHYSYVTGYGRPSSEKLVADFLEGYRQERMVTDRDLDDGVELFYQKEIHGLWVEKEHYLKNSSRVDDLLHTQKFLESIDALRHKNRRPS